MLKIAKIGGLNGLSGPTEKPKPSAGARKK
jgi:hypothetical protein